MNVHFVRKEQTAKQIYTFYFKPEKRPHYTAGQFVEFTLPHDNPDDRGVRRWFTLSSSPTEELLSITTKLIPEASSFKKALAELKPGEPVDMSSPMGDFVLPKDSSIPLIFVAGGIGVTPYHSMIAYLRDSDSPRDLTLLYSAADAESLAFEGLFETLGEHYITSIGARLSAELVLTHTEQRPGSYIYLAGPEPMVETLEKELISSGIQKYRIRTDFFPGYSAL